MPKIKTIEDNVRYVLEKCPGTRGDDFRLVGSVWIACYDLDPSISWAHVFDKHKELGLPSWGSITRARRKLQEKHPELRADKEVEEIRMNAQAEYIGYALEAE